MSRFESLDVEKKCEENLNRYHEYNYVKWKGLNKSAATQYEDACIVSKPYHLKRYSSQNTNLKNADPEQTDKKDVREEHRSVFDKVSEIKQGNNKNESRQILDDVSRGRACTDKTTYCRPVVNHFNQQFLHKTTEKNARLQRLVQDVIIARRREKEKQNWNNYINKLKEKHGNDINRRSTSLHYVPKEAVTDSTIEDCYNTNFECKQSHLYHKLLQDIYDAYNLNNSNDGTHNIEYVSDNAYCPYQANSYCYPISSQGRLLVLERERQKQLLLNRRYNKALYKSLIEEEKPNIFCNMGSMKSTQTNQNFYFQTKGTNTITDHKLTQTEFQPVTRESIHKMVESKSNFVSTTVGGNEVKSIKKLQDSILGQSSLDSIEKKLDTLIHSINSFIIEVKSKRSTKYNKCRDNLTEMKKENVNFTKSDIFGLATKEKIICGLVENSSNSTAYSSDLNVNEIKNIDCNLSKINEIISKAMDKNKFVNLKDSCVGESYHPCSVQISFHIPTKEMYTEVTNSLSKAEYSSEDKNVTKKETNPLRSNDRRIAIAVNTDPVSILAFLWVSTEETIRRLLSIVPRIDYFYYLSRLQGSQTIESQYICNICGTSFMKPSQLTDHIQKHELGKTRDCCVCRHVLDMPRRRPGLFKCQYCGQRFTRAYCCELHQQSCARRLGIPHDVASSLMLLK